MQAQFIIIRSIVRNGICDFLCSLSLSEIVRQRAVFVSTHTLPLYLQFITQCVCSVM